MNDYKITFAPELEISAAEFAESWNSLDSCRTVAEAKTETATQNDFADMVTIVSLSVVSAFAADLLLDLVKDAIKDWIAKCLKKMPQATHPALPAPEDIEVQQIELPDGTKLLIIVIKK